MFDTPLREAHLRVLDRLAGHRADAARQAESARGADDRRAAVTGTRELETAPWGVTADGGDAACEIVLDYGELEAEYAAIRRGTALFDRVDRVVVELRGTDAVDLVDRLVTNAVAKATSAIVAAFLLERTGRIVSDLRVIRLDGRLLLEMDRTDAAAVAAAVDRVVFTEDCTIEDASAAQHRLDALGPEAPATIEHLVGRSIGAGEAAEATIDGVPVVVFALDPERGGDLDVPGIGIVAPTAEVERVWNAIIERPAPGRRPVRAIGWNAFNIARIEAGTPLFHLDFGPDALPHETGLIAKRVDFRKGCYPGQEVVARMESRAGGRGRRRVVGLRLDGAALPVAGGQVFDAEGGIADQVGVVTSSTVSPMRGAASIAFATVRASHVDPGTRVLVNADGGSEPATVTGLDLELELATDAGTSAEESSS